jgi:hypothetical protein
MMVHSKVSIIVNDGLSLGDLFDQLRKKGIRQAPQLSAESCYILSPKWQQEVQAGCRNVRFQVVTFDGGESGKVPADLRSPTPSECIHFFLSSAAEELLHEGAITAHDDYFRERGNGKMELRWMNQRGMMIIRSRRGDLCYLHSWYQTFDEDDDWDEASADVYSAVYEDYVEVPVSVPRGPRAHDSRSRYLFVER